jgi:hypothetical protein
VAVFFGLVVAISWVATNIFSSFPLMLVGDVAALVISYILYLLWHDRPISLQCANEKCRKLILSNTPWVCGFCKQTNRNANQFPFVHQCAHCGDEAKTYRCHHCGEFIFLTKDEDKINYAYSLNAPAEKSSDDKYAENLKKLRANKEMKDARLSLAQVDAELLRLRKIVKPQMPKKKSAREILQAELESDVEWDIAEQEVLAAIDQEHKDNPKLKRRLKIALASKIRSGLVDR